jgi:dihydrofolate reductase
MSQRAEMPSIAYVVARSYPDNIIGCDNTIPWHVRSDMKRFRSITQGHAVIMGRKTLESIGHPLPKRLNIVLTRTEEADQLSLPFFGASGSGEGNIVWATSVESALFFADLYSIINKRRQVFVIGGSEIYRIFSDIFFEIFLTIVMAPNIVRCSNRSFSYFEYEFRSDVWKTLEEQEIPASDQDEYPTRFVRYKKKKDIRRRYRDLAEFLTPDEAVTDFRRRWAGIRRPIHSEERLAEQIRLFWPQALQGAPEETD